MLFFKVCVSCLSTASCVPPCQNGGMCLRPQLCVCKPGTKGKACETTAAQDTSSPVFGGQSPVAASSWVPPEQTAKHTSSKKADALPRVSPMAQMTLTLKPKPSAGLSQQIHSQWVMLILPPAQEHLKCSLGRIASNHSPFPAQLAEITWIIMSLSLFF